MPFLGSSNLASSDQDRGAGLYLFIGLELVKGPFVTKFSCCSTKYDHYCLIFFMSFEGQANPDTKMKTEQIEVKCNSLPFSSKNQLALTNTDER